MVQDLKILGVKPGVEIEIVRALLRGRRTVPELVEMIFNIDNSSAEFHAYYMRIWRSVRELEAKGLVSGPILGRDKAYRLTGYGLGVLLGLISKGEDRPKGIFLEVEIALFVLTFAIGILMVLVPVGTNLMGAFFVFMLGASTSRIFSALWGVW